MLSTCYHCHAKLGTNDALEALPIGRRIAYDGERGRVWVVCGKCARWNLTPFEERWEALEQAERLYRGTRARVSTDNIALARVADGTELVRIGRPLRPEFAAWRYGREFRARRIAFLRSPRNILDVSSRSMMLVNSGAIIAGGALSGNVSWLVAFSGIMFGNLAFKAAWKGRYHWGMARTHVGSGGDPLGVTRADIWRSFLSTEGEALRVQFEAWPERRTDAVSRLVLGRARRTFGAAPTGVELTGVEAEQWLRLVLPAVQIEGGSRGEIEQATSIIDCGTSPSVQREVEIALTRHRSRSPRRLALAEFPAAQRLAMEMLLADDDERRLMSGELATLYERWQEAERVASIADRLLREHVPPTDRADLRETPQRGV